MSESKEHDEQKKTSSGIIILVIGAVLAVAGFAAYKSSEMSATPDAITQAINKKEQETKEAEKNADKEDTTAEKKNFDFTPEEIEKLAEPRVLGDPNAPVRIAEHSSFTCGHCARFHATNFKDIKRDYIDTGKAYLVFDDFPLNKHDMAVGAVARCVPEESYFNFIQLMFETQEEWRKDGYISYLTQNATMAGATEDDVYKCLSSRPLHEKMAQRREDNSAQYDVTSTPTLVINGKKILGLATYSEIQALLDKEYEKASEAE